MHKLQITGVCGRKMRDNFISNEHILLKYLLLIYDSKMNMNGATILAKTFVKLRHNLIWPNVCKNSLFLAMILATKCRIASLNVSFPSPDFQSALLTRGIQ